MSLVAVLTSRAVAVHPVGHQRSRAPHWLTWLLAVLTLFLIPPTANAQRAPSDTAEQTVLDTVMHNFVLRDVSVDSALRRISREGGVPIVYDRTAVRALKDSVNLTATSMTVREALAIALRRTELWPDPPRREEKALLLRSRSATTPLEWGLTLTMQDVPLDSALDQIAKAAGVVLKYDRARARSAQRRVTLSANNDPVGRALLIALPSAPFEVASDKFARNVLTLRLLRSDGRN